MPEVRPMTTDILIWLFSGVTTLHLIAMVLVWIGVFIPGKLGFKNDPILRTCIVIYLICEVLVTLVNVGEGFSLLLTYLGGAALFLGLSRLVRWLVFHLKSKRS